VTDIFEEVEEQLRSERYRNLAIQVFPWAVGLAVIALVAALGYWGWDTYRTRQSNKASEDYAAAMDMLPKGDTLKAYARFGEVAKAPSRTYKSLALMQQAAIRLQANATGDAVKLFDQAAATAPDPVIGDLARLKSALALMDTAPYAAMEERLKPLTEEKRPYRAAAFEALAMAKLQAGKAKDARGDFVVLTLMPGAPESVRQRAQEALALIDSGSAKDLPAVVKAAAALPPPINLPPAAAPQPAQPAGAAQ
jgi:hypothetical protein